VQRHSRKLIFNIIPIQNTNISPQIILKVLHFVFRIYIYAYKVIKRKWAGSVVCIATGYGLDGPGIEFRWGWRFPHLSRPAVGSTQHPVQWVPGRSRG
jgi:hypothetical protein